MILTEKEKTKKVIAFFWWRKKIESNKFLKKFITPFEWNYLKKENISENMNEYLVNIR